VRLIFDATPTNTSMKQIQRILFRDLGSLFSPQILETYGKIESEFTAQG